MTGRLIREMEDEEEQQHSLLFGTPDYCAPEQLMGPSVDARTDVFGLGLVLYEVLTGQRPYGQDDDPDLSGLTREQYAHLVFDRIQHERPVRPSQLVHIANASDGEKRRCDHSSRARSGAPTALWQCRPTGSGTRCGAHRWVIVPRSASRLMVLFHASSSASSVANRGVC